MIRKSFYGSDEEGNRSSSEGKVDKMGNGKLNLDLCFFILSFLEIPFTSNRQSDESVNTLNESASVEQPEERSVQPPIPPRRQFSNEANKIGATPPVPAVRTTVSQRFQFDSTVRTPPPLPPKPNVSV